MQDIVKKIIQTCSVPIETDAVAVARPAAAADSGLESITVKKIKKKSG
jgi:hypothetical protein